MPTTTTDPVLPPARMRQLPRDSQGRVTPWWAATLTDGSRSLEQWDPAKRLAGLRWRHCWMCGARRGRHSTYVVSPPAAVKMIVDTPGSHRDCSLYVAQAYPQPGVWMLWTSHRDRTVTYFDRPQVNIGTPVSVTWIVDGRPTDAVDLDLPAGSDAASLLTLYGDMSD